MLDFRIELLLSYIYIYIFTFYSSYNNFYCKKIIDYFLSPLIKISGFVSYDTKISLILRNSSTSHQMKIASMKHNPGGYLVAIEDPNTNILFVPS